MNPLVLLMGLLLLSYIGSFLVGGRAIRGFGLPSGSEYVALGFAIGPIALGLVPRSMFESFEPIAHVALGWLAFVIGLHYGVHQGKRVGAGIMITGWLLSLLGVAIVAAAVWLVLDRFVPTFSPLDRILTAGGVGAACAETTRHAVRWVVERHRADGPLAKLVGELSDVDDLVPLVSVAILFALAPTEHALHVAIPTWGWVALTVGLGAACGSIATILLGRDPSLDASWGVLLGTALLAIGTAARLGLSPLPVMFFMGLSISVLSRHKRDIVAMVAPTERPVLLPALVLAGAHIEPLATPALPWIVAAALAARVASKLFGGFMLRLFAGPARSARVPWVGLALLSSGALSMSIGLGFALRFPGVVGHVVLATAAAATLFGEFVGPASLRAALARAGELGEPTPLPVPASDIPKVPPMPHLSSIGRPSSIPPPSRPGGSGGTWVGGTRS